MNKNTDHGQTPDFDPGQPVDKTFVEGAGTVVGPDTPKPGVRLDSTTLAGRNPYATSTGGQAAPRNADQLPSGNEPIPLGSGTIVGLLGAGGMAKVYKIWNEKLEVFRAVKILIPGQSTDLHNRFETEAKITAKLHHPNIVEIYSVGEFNTLPLLEMELIDGFSLESIIQKYGRLPEPVCCSVAIMVARALNYAHSQIFLLYGKSYHGVIHRDLKPANIMVSLQGGVKLMDFGIARPTEASLHTVEGNVVGTMQYLSPEQLDGVDIDARTDLYSFGAILYEMLTGTKTFPQNTITNLMKKKISNEYRRFSEFDFAVDSRLRRTAQKCLEYSREKRFTSAGAMLKELEATLETLTNDSPEDVLKSYIADPLSFKVSGGRKLPSWLTKPAFLVPVGVAAAAAALVTVFIVTGPKSDGGDRKPATAAPPVRQPVAAPPAAVVQPPDDGLKPLDPTAASAQSPEPKLPVRAPVTAAPAPRDSRPQPAVRPEPVKKPVTATKPSSLSPLDELKKKYETDDLVRAGQAAVAARSYSDAILALENVPADHKAQNLRIVLLLEAYVESGRTADGAALLTGASMNDAQYDYLAGRVYQAQGKDKKALDFYQSAIIKPSNARNPALIRKDALYYTAVIWGNYYRNNPSADNRLQARNAWLAAKNQYSNEPNHPRFKQANTELANIQ